VQPLHLTSSLDAFVSRTTTKSPSPLDFEHEGEAKLCARGLHAALALDLPEFWQGHIVGLEVLLLCKLVL